MIKKKILYIDTPLEPPGGGQMSLLTLLKNIDRDKFDFKVFISRDGIFKKMLEENKIDVEVVRIKDLFSKIREYNPDVVHINSACTKYTFFSAFFSKILGKKVVWHNRVVESSPLKERIISFFVDRIIVISDAVRKKFYYAGNKVVKVYNPVDIGSIRIETEPDKLKKILNIPLTAKVIGVFSRLEKWKGHKLLFEAFSKINDNVYLLICGDGNEKKNLEKFAREIRILDRVIFCGFVENVYDYMNICDVVVNPSVEPEPFGRVIVEAMVLGKPVVATSLGGACEVIDSNIDGVLVEPEKGGLKNALVRVLNEREFYDKISKNAKRKARIFDVRYHLNEILKVYKDLYE